MYISGTETTQLAWKYEACADLRNARFDETRKFTSVNDVLGKFKKISWTATLIGASSV